ncbi:MAG: restriction endonuclease subunit S [Porticoccaceae bacterium]
MTPELLLQHFNRISEAPDAIPRLRRFILDLAVRGKLVEQDPNDEPAAELLKRIEAEKARLVKLGLARSGKSVAKFEESPFRLPKSWQWSQLGIVGFISPRNLAEDDLLTSFVPMPMISADYGVSNQHEIRPWGEIKSGYTHFAEGDVGLAKITPCFENGKSSVFRGLAGGIGAGTTELHIVRPVLLSADYIVIFLKSPYFIGTGIPKMTGTAGQKRVPTEYFTTSPFPLPPLAEQQRIVAKVDELMALCDQLEAERNQRETHRDKLVVASLNRISTSTAEEATQAARFHLNHLPRLTTKPEHIKQLRQTILNLAVRGKLVPQDPNDEPAGELLKRIQAEKDKNLLTQRRKGAEKGKSGFDSRCDVAALRETAFDLPVGWEWTTLGELSSNIHYGYTASADHTNKDVRLLRISDIQDNKVVWETVPGCEIEAKLIDNYALNNGDLLIARTGGTIGKTYLVENLNLCSVFASYLIRIVPNKLTFPKYVKVFAESPVYWQQLHEKSMGTGQPNVNGTALSALKIPLPPLAEQQRIVAKVDELMSLCDQLEAQLAITAADSRRLLEAVLRDALQPSTVAA